MDFLLAFSMAKGSAAPPASEAASESGASTAAEIEEGFGDLLGVRVVLQEAFVDGDGLGECALLAVHAREAIGEAEQRMVNHDMSNHGTIGPEAAAVNAMMRRCWAAMEATR